MTEAEKKMKKYTRGIERRLNLPREIKARVMSDFVSSITARRESGMTDEEIYAELGTPKKVAADLNEQMKDFTYRKSPWRFAFAALAVYGGANLLGGIAAQLLFLFLHDPVFSMPDAASIGIIGGADGPTSVFITTSVEPLPYMLLPAALLAIGIWGFLRLCKCKQK